MMVALAVPADRTVAAAARQTAGPTATVVVTAGRPARAPAAAGASARARPPAAFPLYQRLLDDYLRIVPRPGEPLATAVDYVALHAPAGAARLAAVRREMLSVTPARLDPAARLAWAINTYNALVIEQIAGAFDARLAADAGVPGARLGVMDLTKDNQTFFEAPQAVIEGHPYSLNTFETHFVFADFDRAAGGQPPRELDPRSHFALVCGARGCPPLQPRAFTRDSLDAQLDAATRAALSSPTHLRLEAGGRILGSELFAWYAADFGGAEGVVAFVRRYAPEPVQREIDRRKPQALDGKIPWDWAFNAAPPRFPHPR